MLASLTAALLGCVLAGGCSEPLPQDKQSSGLQVEAAKPAIEAQTETADAAAGVPTAAVENSVAGEATGKDSSGEFLYSIYAGSYKTEQQAKIAMQQLVFSGYTCELVKTDIFMLRVKTTRDYSEAQSFMYELEKLGHPEAYVTRKKLAASEQTSPSAAK